MCYYFTLKLLRTLFFQCKWKVPTYTSSKVLDDDTLDDSSLRKYQDDEYYSTTLRRLPNLKDQLPLTNLQGLKKNSNVPVASDSRLTSGSRGQTTSARRGLADRDYYDMDTIDLGNVNVSPPEEVPRSEVASDVLGSPTLSRKRRPMSGLGLKEVPEPSLEVKPIQLRLRKKKKVAPTTTSSTPWTPKVSGSCCNSLGL